MRIDLALDELCTCPDEAVTCQPGCPSLDRCLDCGQPRDARADRHCRATSTEWVRTYHRWSDE